MTTETKILTDEQIQEWIDDNLFFEHPTKFVPVIVQAVLQSPEVQAWRKDAERLHHCLDHGFPQKWEEGVRGVVRTYWTERPGAQEEYRTALDAIDAAMEGKE